MTELAGSCLCGGVSFTTSVEVQDFYYCHCQQCRKLSGSAFAANVLAKPSPVTWVSGEELVHRFDYPGERLFSRVFCSNCGSALPFLNESGTTLYIPAGALDTPLPIPPSQNIFWQDRASWFEAGVGAEHVDGFPS